MSADVLRTPSELALDVARVLVMQVEVDPLEGIPADGRLGLPGDILAGTATEEQVDVWARLSLEAQMVLHGAAALVTVASAFDGLGLEAGWRDQLSWSALRIAMELQP